MAKKISKKQKKQRILFIQDDSMDDEVVPESPLKKDQTGKFSPVRDSPVKSTHEETRNLDGTVKNSIMDTTINQGEQPKLSTPQQTTIVPPEVLNTESFHEEVRTSGVTANVSDTDVNVHKGDGVLTNEA